MEETVGKIEFGNSQENRVWKQSDKIGNTCEECLAEMFRRVGEKYPNPELTANENWFQLRTWTEEEEKDFEKWMYDFLKKRLRWNKATLKREIGMFLLMWGWKTKDGGYDDEM